MDTQLKEPLCLCGLLFPEVVQLWLHNWKVGRKGA